MSASGQGSWDASAPSGSAGRLTSYGYLTDANPPTSAPAAGAGWSAAGSGLIPLAPVPATDVAAMTADQIMPLLHGLQPGAVTDAGQAHLRLGQNLAATADRLAAHGQTLLENWTGQSSDTAMARLEQVHAQTLTLAQAATQAGDVLTWLGQTVLPSFKELPDPRGGLLNAGGSLITGLEHAAGYLTGNTSAAAAAAASSAADATARNYLTALNGYLVEASSNLPTAMGAAAVTNASAIGTAGGRAGAAGGSPGASVGFPSGAAAGAGLAGGARSPAGRVPALVPASNAGGGRPSPGAPSPGAPSPGTGSVLSSPPGSLQSVPTPPGSVTSSSSAMPGTSSAAGGIGPAAGEASGPLPGVTSVAGLGIPGVSPNAGAGLPGASAADDVPDVPGFGAGANGYGADAYGPGSGPVSAGAASAQDGSYGASAADGGTAADGATGADMAGFPLMGTGSASQRDRERQRQAWTYEDEDIWGGPTGCVPAVIEGTDWIWKKSQGR